MFTQIDHIAIATSDIDKALETYRKLGSVVLGAPEEVPSQKVKAQMLVFGGTPIELIQPTSPESTVAKFIEKKGEGLHHMAFRVANIDEALKAAEAEGFALIDKAPRHGYAGARVAFMHPKSTNSVLTELVERAPGKDAAPYEMPE